MRTDVSEIFFFLVWIIQENLLMGSIYNSHAVAMSA
jgi:hypothetical protein